MGNRPLFVAFCALVVCLIIKGLVWGISDMDDENSNQEGDDCYIKGTITKITKGKNNDILWIKDDNYGKVIVYLSAQAESNYQVGNIVEDYCEISKLSNRTNEGGFNALNYYYYTYRVKYCAYSDGVIVVNNKVNYILNELYYLKSKFSDIVNEIYDEKDAGIVKSMLFADKSSLDDETKHLFSENGIAHILAISGLHVSILGGIIYFILYKLTSSIKISTIISILIILLYGMMTGFNVSTNRAVVMLIIVMISKMIGRTYDMLSAIGLSGIIILCINCYQIYSTGFQLSFLAVIAVCTFYPIVCKIFDYENDDGESNRIKAKAGDLLARKKKYPFVVFISRKIQGSLLMSICISLVTLPVILYNYYEIGYWSIALNIIVIPLMTIVVGCSFASCVLGMLSKSVGTFFAGGVHYILCLYRFICGIPNKLGLTSFVTGCPKVIQIIIYYIMIIVVTVIAYCIKNDNSKYYIKKTYIIVLFVVAYCCFNHKADNKLHVDMLYVGQGDGIIIRMPDDKIALVDGGSSSESNIGEYIIIPYLKYHGNNKIDYVFLSHLDDDHISGVVEILENNLCEIGTIYLADIEQDDKYMEIVSLANRCSVDVKYLSQGDKLVFGSKEDSDKSVNVQVVYPESGSAYEDRNDVSMSFLLNYGKFNCLFTGDIGKEQEEDVLNYMLLCNKQLDIDILKVAHHGSKNSSSENFINGINAKNGIISAGENNRYNHPAKETLQRIDDAGMNCYVTIDSGQICICADLFSYNIKGLDQ